MSPSLIIDGVPPKSVQEACLNAQHNIKLPNTTFSFLTTNSSDIEETAQLLTSVFINHEPLTAAVAATRPVQSLHDSLLSKMQKACEACAREGLSPIIKSNGQIIGALLVSSFQPELDTPAPNEPTMPETGMEPVKDILHQLSDKFKSSSRFPAPDTKTKTIELEILAIAANFQGHALAGRLLQLALFKASKEEYEEVMVKATSRSQKVFEKAGLETVGIVRYDEYEFKGEKVFAGVEGIEGAKIMWGRIGDLKK